MKRFTLTILALGIASFFVACGGGEQQSSEEPEATTDQVEAEAPAPDLSAGEAIYNEKCLVCHQATGLGLPNAFPPLANSDYLFADPKRAVKQVLYGSHEEMIVNGEVYNQPMTPQVKTLQEAVDVINYVLNTWGNDGGFLTIDDVSDIPLPEEAE